MSLVGRTIVSANDSGNDRLHLVLDDDTQITFAETEYGYTVERQTLAEIEAEAWEERRARHRAEIERKRRAEEKRRRCEVACSTMTPEQYKQWYEETYGLTGFSKVMKQHFVGPIREALNQPSLLFSKVTAT